MPARLSSLFARGPAPGPSPPAPEGPAGEPRRGPERIPPPSRLRRERRSLMRRREEKIRDVGGLALEMYRRDRFRPEILLERCGEVVALEERIHELDALLAAAAAAARGLRGMTRCRCGAPLPRGAHFCAHCGRPAPETPPASTCGRCGQPLPAETNFCPACGNAAAAEDFAAEEGAAGDESYDATIAERAASEGDRSRGR